MANIVLGIATSHGPILVTAVDQWKQRLSADRASTHWWRRHTWTFEELIAARNAEDLSKQREPAEQLLRRKRCLRAIDGLAEAFHSSRIDVAVIVGND
jgi:3-O-methylgallate 3,4-dioxygenase